MSVMAIMGAVTLGASVLSNAKGAKNSQLQAKKNARIQKQELELAKINVQKQTAWNVEQQYKQMNSFMEAQDSIIASQTAFLGAGYVDSRSSIYQDVRTKQEGDFYEAEQTVTQNIEKAYADERMTLLGLDMNISIGQSNMEDQIKGSKLGFFTSTLGSLSNYALTSSMYGANTKKPNVDNTVYKANTNTSLGLNIFD
jgi:hypothetical protein